LGGTLWEGLNSLTMAGKRDTIIASYLNPNNQEERRSEGWSESRKKKARDDLLHERKFALKWNVRKRD